jgi:hypothetical protein
MGDSLYMYTFDGFELTQEYNLVEGDTDYNN